MSAQAKFPNIVLPLAVVGAVLPCGAWAQDAIELQTISVETARFAKPVNAIPGTFTLLDEEQIEQQTLVADDLASVLENTVPGFGPSLQKLTGRAETFRGRNPLYLIDGVPQHNALRDGSRDGHTIDIDFIERIEVIHGANAIQGIGATGGIVGLRTKTARKTGSWENDVKLTTSIGDNFDSDGFTYKGSWLGGIGTDNYDVTTGVAYKQTGMFYDGDGDFVGLYPTQGDIMDSESRDLFFKAGYQLSPDQRVQLMVNDFELERNHDFRSVDGDPDAGIPTTSERGAPVDVGDPAKNDVTTVTLDYNNAALLGGSFNAQLYYQDYQALFEGGTFGDFFRLTPNGPPFLDQSSIESEKKGVKLTQTWRNIAGIKGLTPSLGFDHQRDATAQVLARSGREWVPETTLKSSAPFVQLDYDFTPRLRATVGVRYEQAELEVDDYVTIAAANSTPVGGGNPDFSESLTNLGLSFDLTDNLTIYGSFSEGFTMPDVGRVLRAIDTPGLNVDSLIDLQPVVTDNTEVGLNFNFDRGSLHIAWYRSDSDLGSRLDLNANDVFEVRREKTEIEGWEVTGDFNVTDSLLVGANYSSIEGRFDSDGNGSVDSDFDGLNIAPDRLNLYAEMDFNSGNRGRIQIAHLRDRNFRSDIPGEAEFEFNGYTTVDMSFVSRTRYGDFSLGVDNLLDKQYITYFSQAQARQRDDAFFAGRGRTLTLSYRKEL